MRRSLVLAVVVVIAACSARNPDQTFFSEVAALTKEEIFAQGEAKMAEKSYEEGRRYFSFLADSFPNDPVGRKAALKVADSFFQAKDSESVVEAQLRYRDFANRFPNDSGRAYALLMLGRTHFRQQRGSGRDLTAVHEAVKALEQVVELFPDSPESVEAAAILAEARGILANHELDVAKFYLNVGALEGSYNRLSYLLANYPETAAGSEATELMQRIEERRAAAR